MLTYKQSFALFLALPLFEAAYKIFTAEFDAHSAVGDAIRALLDESGLNGDYIILTLCDLDRAPTMDELVRAAKEWKEKDFRRKEGEHLDSLC